MGRLWPATLLLIAAALAGNAQAQSCTTYPYDLQNGQTANADQVMDNFDCAALKGAGRFTGNVGINTTNPTAPLHVVGNDLTVRLKRSPTQAQEWGLNLDGNWFYIHDLTANGGIRVGIAPGPTGPVALAPTGGNVGIGTMQPQAPLHVIGAGFLNTRFKRSAASSAEWGVNLDNNWFNIEDLFNGGGYKISVGPGVNGDVALAPAGGNVGVGHLTPAYRLFVNGSAAGTGNWINASDARLKEDVAPITGALASVQRLRGVHYSWRGEKDRTVGKDLKLPEGREIGLIAQEVEKVVPEAVAKPASSDGVYGLKEGALVAVLVEAIKEQQAQIEALQRRLAALEGRPAN